MKPFVISTESFNFGIGGLTVLHRLCHLLNTNGADAYLAPSANSGRENYDFNKEPFYIYEKYKTKVTDITQWNPNDYIAIYPEGWFGNHMAAKNIVRWILGPPDKDHVDTWNDHDVWFWYLPMYMGKKYNKQNYIKDIDKQLFVAEFHQDIFINKNFSDKQHTCWTLRKAQGKIDETRYIHPSSSIFLPYHVGCEPWTLADLFNKCSRFYCYDTYTFMPIQAAMCGCEGLVVPDPEISLDDFLNSGPLNKYCAYGLEDLDRANKTCANIHDDINKIEQNTIKQLNVFMEFCNDHFG